MDQKKLSGLSNEELSELRKKTKSSLRISAVLMGLLIGVAAYSAVKNGLKFATFFPLIFVYLLAKNQKDHKAIDKEIKSRGLE